MSLNGLDDPKVVEAYEAATAEPGGWFLLKYEGRDEVQVYNRGKGGIGEARNAVAEYDETSPLYGFLKYRRRSVVFKYLPEDCSRIIQARVAVHFNAVCERFSPYDTIFEITTASELKDSKLSAACSLHTATCSTSSSTSSLRQRRLMEIAEEKEDEQRAANRQSLQGADDQGTLGPTDRPLTAEPVSLNSDSASLAENNNELSAATNEASQFIDVTTPSDSDVFTMNSYFHTKPKVKLGPRPSADAHGRQQVAGNFRPVSAVPAGFKLFGKVGRRGKGRDSSSASPLRDENGDATSIAAASIASDDTQDRPGTSSSSVTDSAPLPSPTMKKPAISREKARLMKAMKLREEKKKMSMISSAEKPSADGAGAVNTEENVARGPDEAMPTPEPDAYSEKRAYRLSLNRDESALVTDNCSQSLITADQSSLLTPSDSHPASPVVGSSETGHSSKASSISEPTDEAMQVKDKQATPQDEAFKASHPSVAIVAKVAEDPAATVAQPPTASNSDENGDVAPSKGETSESAALAVPKLPAHDPARRVDDGHAPTTVASTPQDTAALSDPTFSAGIAAQFSCEKDETPAQDLCTAVEAAPQPGATTPPAPVEEHAAKVSQSGTSLLAVKNEPSERRSHKESAQTTANWEQQAETTSDSCSQSVVLEEGTPITIIRTPVTSNFPPGPLKGEDERPLSAHTVRTVSNPVRGNLISPADPSQPSARSLSSGAAYVHHLGQQQPGGHLLKKSNIGSSISQRIKALEKLSAGSAGSADAPAPGARERPSSTFFAVKKREAARASSVMARANSFRNQTPPSPDQTHDSSPEAGRRNRLERSGSVTSRLSLFETPITSPSKRTLGPAPPTGGSSNSNSSGSGSGSNAGRGRPEAVSVMARIIRDPNQSAQTGFDPCRDPSEYGHLELKQSPLLVDHHTSSLPDRAQHHHQQPPAEAAQQAKLKRSRPPSISIVKGLIKERRRSAASDAENSLTSPGRAESAHANAAFSPRLSLSSHRSSFSKDRDLVLSSGESGSGDDAKSYKKLSRAGRFMRRLSNLSSSKSKNSNNNNSSSSSSSNNNNNNNSNNISPLPNHSTRDQCLEPAQARPSTTGTPSIVTYMGDVNVQFPDNLLWKRRNMCLDSQGFLILSALPATTGRPAPGTKRYHVGEFRAPYIPDVEVQELPNSVVLDFIEGSGIQVACEDRNGQLRVLQSKLSAGSQGSF
ncbi:hypothetical protein UVI_02003040 [Ustilaginoidea virens]|uniref:Uncharacterized protein n=1 Tax=Ustilaginoidea virens TaxID=1159556 RepID=A0A1B5L293_USTVR|nr:hypothetical protein UVI_02003040 [Ustilaginoidea virens]